GGQQAAGGVEAGRVGREVGVGRRGAGGGAGERRGEGGGVGERAVPGQGGGRALEGAVGGGVVAEGAQGRGDERVPLAQVGGDERARAPPLQFPVAEPHRAHAPLQV